MKLSKKEKAALEVAFADVRSFRVERNENQTEFWGRFGVKQSGGSRYESGREIPYPVRILMSLWILGRLDTEALQAIQEHYPRGNAPDE